MEDTTTTAIRTATSILSGPLWEDLCLIFNLCPAAVSRTTNRFLIMALTRIDQDQSFTDMRTHACTHQHMQSYYSDKHWSGRPSGPRGVSVNQSTDIIIITSTIWGCVSGFLWVTTLEFNKSWKVLFCNNISLKSVSVNFIQRTYTSRPKRRATVSSSMTPS